jgi:DNA-binding transcriptional MerR regulator
MEAVRETIGIGEAARELGLSVDTLRYYERAGLLDGIVRTEGNQRRYDRDALTTVQFVTKLRASGMPIRTIRRYMTWLREGEDTIEARQRILEEHRASMVRQMEELQAYLEIVDLKIEMYARRIDPRSDHPHVLALNQRLAASRRTP